MRLLISARQPIERKAKHASVSEVTRDRASVQPNTSHLDLLRVESQVEDEDERRRQRRRRVRRRRRHVLDRGVAGEQLRGQHLLVDAGVVGREGVAAVAV
jgi:hypothetical protein